MKKEKRKYIFILIFVVGAIAFIGSTLSQFYDDIQARVYYKQIETMQDLSMQGSAVVEKKLAGLVNTLYGLAEYLEEDDITNSSNVEKISSFLEKREIGFQRIGVADAEGNAKVTNGESINISDREYFRVCMEEKHGTTEIRQSVLIDKPICIVAVPILREDGESIGIIYGVMEISMFQIYDNTILENKDQYIQIIDTNGDYIVKEASSLIGKRENIFDGINSVESLVSAEDIRKQIQEEKQVYTEISDGKSREIVYFTPLKLNNWCVATVIDYSEVTNSVDYILDNDVYKVILKTILAISILCFLLLHNSWKERKQIQKYNEELMLEEKIVSIAAEKSRFAIMSYDIKSRQLRFISDTFLGMKFPKQLENAPEEFMKYIPEDEELQKQAKVVLDSMQNGVGKREFPMVFSKNGKQLHLRVQLTNQLNVNGQVRQCIGVIEDITEEQNLREKANRDSLTGLYNRSAAMEKIEECMNKSELISGTVHACIVMDIDNFKTLNDTLGHQMGDKALQDIAKILLRHFRNYDVVCRLGGDEFLVFLKNIPPKAIYRNIESLLKKLILTYQENGISVQITMSAGIALVTDTKMDLEEMYHQADIALYQVKHEEKNSFKIFENMTE